VVNVEVVEVSPLETAFQEVEEKTKELALLHLKYQALAKTTQDVSTNALAMCLNSAVDAPQNAGIPSYRQIFFNPSYVVQFPDRAEMVDKLRAAIDEQVTKIFKILEIH
jgi:dedicator of cytokinesis protein 3